MAAMLELSAEEAAMNGAPEGELYVANVIERDAVQPVDDPTSLISELQEKVKDIKSCPWHEQFTFADQCRQIIIHSKDSITSDFADELTVALCAMGESSRSVRAHNGIITIGDLLVKCPSTMMNEDTLSMAINLLFDLCKKNKPRVLRDRVDKILKELTESTFSLNEALLVPVLASKHTQHSDLLVMFQTASFLERTVPRLIESKQFPNGMGDKKLTVLLTGVSQLLKSKAADAKSSAKRSCGLMDDALADSEGTDLKTFVQAKNLPSEASSEIIQLMSAASVSPRVSTESIASLKKKKAELEKAKLAPSEESPPVVKKKGGKFSMGKMLMSAHRTGDLEKAVDKMEEDAAVTTGGAPGEAEDDASIPGAPAAEESVVPPKAPVSIWKMVASHMHSRKLRVTELFSVIDKDKSKTVDKKELLDFLKTIGVDANKEDMKEAFTHGGKVEKELSLSQLKAEVTKFSREAQQEAAASGGGVTSRAKSPVRTRSPPKTSGYGQSTSSSASRTKATTMPKQPPKDKESPPSSPKSTTSKKSTKVTTSASSSRATGSTQSSSSRTTATKTATTPPKTTTPAKSKHAAVSPTKPKVSDKASEVVPPSPEGMDALSALAEASRDENDRVRRQAAEAEAGVTLVGIDDDDDWENSNGGGVAKKKQGMILAFDEKGSKAAKLLYEQLLDLSVDVKYKGNSKDKSALSDYQAALDSTALLVVLKTDTYGKEPKNATEVNTIKGGNLSTLVLDLCEIGVKSHLSTILPEDVLEQSSFYRTPGGWNPEEKVPEGMAAHCVNFMIAEQSKSASYNEDISAKFAATSNAKPRRLSKIDFDSLGAEEEEVEEEEEQPETPGGDEGGGMEMDDEEAFNRFQQEQNE